MFISIMLDFNGMKKVRFIIIFGLAAVLLWHLLLPALFVLSLLPQIKKPPIDFVSSAPFRDTVTIMADQEAIPLDVFTPRKGGRADLVIFHAANEQGKDDPRLQRLAEIFARTGLKVFLPTLPSLNRQVFNSHVLQEMNAVIKEARRREPARRLILLSFSGGVGPELIVASQLQKPADLVVGFGGYLDLENVIRYHTTGFSRENGIFQKGQIPDPFGTWLFARYLSQFLPEQDGEIIQKIVQEKQENSNADISELAGLLGPQGRPVVALLLNQDPAEVARLLEEVPTELQNFFVAFDPKPVLADLQSPILLLHSEQDRIIPFGESQKLYFALKQNQKDVKFFKLSVFDHVNPVIPPLTFKNFFSTFVPEFFGLWQAAYKIIYLF